MRRTLIVGNWKMHGSQASVEALVSGLAEAVANTSAEIAVCPVAVHVPQVVALAGESGLAVGGQNCSEYAEGAFTGELAAAMLADAGCRWVILGHSERRQYFGESDELVARKSIAARVAGLTPILCVGETLEQREQGLAEQVVTSQLAALSAVGLEYDDVIAYEPIWAIGTGRTATPEQAQEMHACIRAFLKEHAPEVADSIRLLYGGSVKADNAAELFAQQDIDGGLVGGASLKAADFAALIDASQD
jgi:triosephosphate isomerase (TIM)